MLRAVRAQLLHRRSRTLALLAGIVVATTSFAVLTGTSQTQRLEVSGTVGESFRGSYDILVRPRGSQSERERRTGAVQPNFLSGLTGGISMAQWRRIERLPGMDVAAPIANIGYVLPTARLPVDLSVAVGTRAPALLRAHVSWRSERGLTRAADASQYVYVTPNRLANEPGDREPDPYRRYALREAVPGASRPAPVCYAGFDTNAQAFEGPFSSEYRTQFGCFSTSAGTGRWFFGRLRPSEPQVVLNWSLPLLLSAVDPDAEARLTGIDRSLLGGRYLRADDRPRVAPPSGRRELPARQVPVLAANRTYVDEQADIAIERLSAAATARWRRPFAVDDADTFAPLRFLARQPRGPVIERLEVPANVAYRHLLRQLRNPDAFLFDEVAALWRTGPTRYREGSQTLAPITRPTDDRVWQNNVYLNWAYPTVSSRDLQFREVRGFLASGASQTRLEDLPPSLRAVGVFDPDRLETARRAGAPPLTTLQPPALTARDETTVARLGGRPLRPNGNLGGYLAQPPALLTSLRAARAFGRSTYPDFDPERAISAIRVRVAGVTGIDPVSRERIRQAAERIVAATGLDVDITAGASGAPTAVDLPAGRFGRPRLALTEPWIRKGVATQVLDAIDRKSLVLFALILVVCALFVTNAASAAVRARRSELGVLASMGWSSGRLFAVVLLEVGAVGMAAGALGALLSLPLAAMADVGASVGRAALAMAAATVLALLAGLVPAARAARADPVAAIRPLVLESGRAWRPRSLAQLAIVNVVRSPGRSALAALSLAIGVCALTLLVAATLAFHDTLVGTLLGDAVAVQVRGTDYVAVAATIVLATAAVADVLFLNLRERAVEFATLRATGWDNAALGRLIALEGAWIGVCGGVVGATAGLAGAALFAGSLPVELLVVAAGAAAGGTALATIAALGPAVWLRRESLVPVLAGD